MATPVPRPQQQLSQQNQGSQPRSAQLQQANLEEDLPPELMSLFLEELITRFQGRPLIVATLQWIKRLLGTPEAQTHADT